MNFTLKLKMLCQGCNSALEANNFLKCNTCKSDLCFACLGLTKESSKTLTKEQMKTLNCPYCMNVNNERRRRTTDDTPCRGRQLFNEQALHDSTFIDASLIGASNDSVSGIAGGSSTSSNLMKEPVSMESISKLFDMKMAPDSTIMMNLRSALNKDIEKMVAAHVNRAFEDVKAEFTNTTDYLSAEQNDLRSEIKEKDNEIKQLQSDLIKSQNSLSKLQLRLSAVEKVSRDLNLEIHEVPESKNENLYAVFKKLCECIQVDIPESEVRACRRVAKMDATSRRPRNILVTLSSQKLRDLILSSVTRFNKSHPKERLATTHIGFPGETRRIYLAEHLSPEVKELHSAARKFCKENGFMFVWVRFGQIYIRKNEQSPPLRVVNIESLSKFI